MEGMTGKGTESNLIRKCTKKVFKISVTHEKSGFSFVVVSII